MYKEFEDFLFNCEPKVLSSKTIKSYRNNGVISIEFNIYQVNIYKK